MQRTLKKVLNNRSAQGSFHRFSFIQKNMQNNQYDHGLSGKGYHRRLRYIGRRAMKAYSYRRDWDVGTLGTIGMRRRRDCLSALEAAVFESGREDVAARSLS